MLLYRYSATLESLHINADIKYNYTNNCFVYIIIY